MHQASSHQPVMVDEVAELFLPIETGVVIDATFGEGGHSRRLLETHGPGFRILAIDRDPGARPAARALGSSVRFVQGDFRRLAAIAEAEGIDEASGVLFDLGVSSKQLDDAGRGFSYRRSGPLDMRMGEGRLTAHEVVNTWTEAELASVIAEFGEERFARRVAAAIVAARPIDDTGTLARVVVEAIPAATRRHGGHPARRSFQAIRIAVNDELAALGEGLDAALSLLAPAGRLVVIAYHSLEDRIVKRTLAAWSRPAELPPGMPVEPAPARLQTLTRKPLRPSPEEVTANPRARSARLRAVERVG